MSAIDVQEAPLTNREIKFLREYIERTGTHRALIESEALALVANSPAAAPAAGASAEVELLADLARTQS